MPNVRRRDQAAAMLDSEAEYDAANFRQGKQKHASSFAEYSHHDRERYQLELNARGPLWNICMRILLAIEVKSTGNCGNSQRPRPVRGPIRRIVLIGKTGNGKSATGNTILGCRGVHERKFRVTVGSSSATRASECHVADRFGKRLAVVDTPGLFDTELDPKDIETEIARCVLLSQPGPHVFLLIVRLTNRLTVEEKKALEKVEQMFGEMAKGYTIVVFTGIDSLEDEAITLDELISQDVLFSKLVGKFGNIYHGLNNKVDNDNQVEVLVDKIEGVLQRNEGHFYTNDMYETASIELHKEIEEILRKRLPEIRLRERQLRHLEDIDKLWCDEVKAATEKATGIVATALRNKGKVTISALLGAGFGFALGGPLGAMAGTSAASAVAVGYSLYNKKIRTNELELWIK